MGVYVISGESGLISSPMNTAEGLTVRPLPPGLLRDPVFALNQALREGGESVVIFDRDPTGDGGQSRIVATLFESGWGTSVTDGGWFTCRRSQAPAGTGTIFLGVRQWAPDDPMIGANLSAAYVAHRLATWRSAVGTHYRHTPGSAALSSVRAQGRNRYPKWVLRNQNTMEYWEPPVKLADIQYYSRGGKRVRTGHRWDMRSAYLAAMAAAYLPYDRPEPSGTDPYEFGYFRVRLGNPLDRPYWLTKPDTQGTRWVTHEGYRDLLYTRDGKDIRRTDVELIDSITTTTAGRILRPWAENWRDAMVAHPELAHVFKRGYAELAGLMAVKSGGIYRPDWRHVFMQRVAVSMTGRALEVKQGLGLSPVKISYDSIWYPESVDPEAVGRLLGVGDHIGQMRYEGVCSL